MEFVCYGYKKTAKQLNRTGYMINRKKVRRLMDENNLLNHSYNRTGPVKRVVIEAASWNMEEIRDNFYFEAPADIFIYSIHGLLAIFFFNVSINNAFSSSFSARSFFSLSFSFMSFLMPGSILL